jgi:enamine deaminase RidA (YjgF/YER057c/UK114 family)
MFPNPQDRPAFKVLVGSLPPGQLVQIDGLAVLGQRRRRTDIDGVPARDPTVVLGDWMFTSRVHGIQPNQGVPEDPEAEARWNFENLAALLRLNGFTPADLAQITLFVRDDENFVRAQQAYEQVFPDAEIRPPMHRLNSFITPRFRYSIEMIAKRGSIAPQQAFQEIYLCAGRRPIPAGARLGPLAVAPGLTSADPCTSAQTKGDAEAHLRAAMTNMTAFLTAAGATLDHVARATIYMPNVDDRTAMNAVWSSYYPNEADRPPHKYAPAALQGGDDVRLQVLALPAASRRTVEIPGLKHVDWMSMGARTGNLVTSSRLFGSHAFTGARAGDAAEAARLVFNHATTLLQRADSDWSRIQQVTAFVNDPSQRDIVIAEWRKIAVGGGQVPRLNVVEWHLAGANTPRIEIVATAD